MAKQALCIGINDYPGSSNDLNGCRNDADDWAKELKGRGFEVTALFDGGAKKADMVAQMTRLIGAARADGTWVPDEAPLDEPDGRDEALCPYDALSGNVLTDDELYDIFTQRNARTRLVFVSDSCHSGTVARFAPPLSGDASPRRVRFMPPEMVLDPKQRERARAAARLPARGRARSTALLLAGCRDTEFSYDAVFNGRANGAFTYVALAALRRLAPGSSYLDWFTEIRKGLPSVDYAQTPQLMASRTQKKWRVLE
jgi:hypothetical protein